MSNKPFRDILGGITLGLLIFLVLSTSAVLVIGTAAAQEAPLFSVTMIASTGNPVRRQYATIIASGMQSVGINARVFYLNFDQLVNRMFFLSENQGKSFAEDGYDIGFIGWGFTAPYPDFRSQFDGGEAYLAPTGNNYALYDNPEMNALFNEMYKTTDVNKQIELTWKFQEIVFRDAPYNYVYAPVDIVPRDAYWTAWGEKELFNLVTFPDIEYYAGGNELTFAEVSNVFPGNTLNPFQTASSNSFYALYVYGAVCFSSAGLQQIDARDNSYKLNIATDVTSSADGLTWTVKMKPGVLFHSGVEMTADDALYTAYATLDPATASVGLGDWLNYLGNVVDFTWIDGTTTTIDNRATPDEAVRKGTWTSLDRYTFQFTMPEIYAFTSQRFTSFPPLPKHIYEAFDPATWDSQPFSTAEGPQTYTWDTNKYGGTGSYTAVGPVGAGPYVLESFDFVRNLAVLKKFPNFWNRAELEAAGMYTVETYRVVWIESKDAAIAALKNKEVNQLDNNYQLGRDVPTLEGMGVTVCKSPELGWQEMGFNMRDPIFGTGVDTPAGRADPAQAAEAARHIRKAVSYLIPRQQIVDQLMGGAAEPVATLVGPAFGPFHNPNLKADPYDPNKAVQELQAAGYSVTLTPPAKIAAVGTPFLGQSVRVKGYTAVAGMIVVVEESSDQQTWTPVGATSADTSGNYEVSVPGPPMFGSAWYRADFTGYALNETLAGSALTVDQANALIESGEVVGEGQMVSQSYTDPVAISSVTNDAAVVLVIVIVLILIAVLAMRRRKPAQTKAAK